MIDDVLHFGEVGLDVFALLGGVVDDVNVGQRAEEFVPRTRHVVPRDAKGKGRTISDQDHQDDRMGASDQPLAWAMYAALVLTFKDRDSRDSRDGSDGW